MWNWKPFQPENQTISWLSQYHLCVWRFNLWLSIQLCLLPFHIFQGCQHWFPCLGLQKTSDTRIFLLPSLRETLSSPIVIIECVILLKFDLPIWIPSIFRLSSSAKMLILFSFNLWQQKMSMWKNLLSTDYTPVIVESSIY